MKKYICILPALFGLMVCVLLQGCETVMLSAPVASEQNVAFLKAANMKPVSLGNFDIDLEKFGKEGRIFVLSGYLGSPYGDTFAHYLHESVRTELAAAGLYSPSADTVITSKLSESHLEVGWTESAIGSGSLTGTFIVTTKGVVTYQREISINETWESSFIARAAIPRAIDKYEGMFQKMVSTLFNDPKFRNALGGE